MYKIALGRMEMTGKGFKMPVDTNHFVLDALPREIAEQITAQAGDPTRSILATIVNVNAEEGRWVREKGRRAIFIPSSSHKKDKVFMTITFRSPWVKDSPQFTIQTAGYHSILNIIDALLSSDHTFDCKLKGVTVLFARKARHLSHYTTHLNAIHWPLTVIEVTRP